MIPWEFIATKATKEMMIYYDEVANKKILLERSLCKKSEMGMNGNEVLQHGEGVDTMRNINQTRSSVEILARFEVSEKYTSANQSPRRTYSKSSFLSCVKVARKEDPFGLQTRTRR
jgi:hypothetical protein